jgi:hypothetical protein
VQTATIAGTGETASARPAARRPAVHTRFYLGLATFMGAIVVAGFWPSYFGPMLRGNVARPIVVQLHGVVFVGWMALLVLQVAVAARGRVSLHRRIGRWGIAYGCLVLVMGLAVGLAAPVMHANAGDWSRDRAAGFLLTTLGDMVLFGSFFGAAVWYKSRPEIHKRLMVVATVALLFAAVGRMGLERTPALFELVWLSPVLAGIAYDGVARRRVHPAYVIGLVGLFVGSMRVLLEESDVWLVIGRPLLDALRS